MDEIIALYGSAVALTDRAVADIPGIPPGHTEISHLGQYVCGMLIDGEDLANAGLPGLAAKGTDGKFSLAEIIFAHHVIDADRIGRCAVLVLGTGIYILIAVIENVVYIIYQISICFGHIRVLSAL